jgi:enolase
VKSNEEFLDGSNKEGLDLVKEAIEKAGYTGKVKIGMDVAASEFFTRKCALIQSSLFLV